MSMLFSTIAIGTVQIRKAAFFMAAAAAHVGPPRKKHCDVSPDGHTLKDIGVELGSICWL